MKLRAGVRITVVRKRVVRQARIKSVLRTRFIRQLVYHLEPRTIYPEFEGDEAISLDDKGKLWVVGWDGPQVRALATVVALGGIQ